MSRFLLRAVRWFVLSVLFWWWSPFAIAARLHDRLVVQQLREIFDEAGAESFGWADVFGTRRHELHARYSCDDDRPTA